MICNETLGTVSFLLDISNDERILTIATICVQSQNLLVSLLSPLPLIANG